MSEIVDVAVENPNTNTRIGVKIDPALQAEMDPLIVIVRGTVANCADERTLANTLLLTLAGMGLATKVRKQADFVWVSTERLKELQKTPTAPFDLTPFITASIAGNGEPRMTESLRLILRDIITNDRAARPEIIENITVDSTLLALAGCGLAYLAKEPGDQWIWSPKIALIDKYKMGKGIEGLAYGPKAEIKIDLVLKCVINNFAQMARLRNGHNVNKRVLTVTTLLETERAGDAIAYLDGEGQLAWKASGSLQQAFE